MGASSPTQPDVEALIEAIPPESMEPGEIYAYEDVANAINIKPDSVRFRTITNAWRNQLRTALNIDMVAERSVGFRVLHDHERVTAGMKNAKGARRGLARAAVRIDRADRSALDERTRAQADHAI